ncbi:hypothetical protein BDN71DRAFT_1286854 [Pleurotus eryngii]|uniref:Uncharacterized protein n=1 Tax=Pleurotus eryngii TaxID=5323 RepID=A0A9P6DCF6_PLEER|nr:hypothetical protein BDN71DRAFT_1286854 [Pleurotus eryngii]
MAKVRTSTAWEPRKASHRLAILPYVTKDMQISDEGESDAPMDDEAEALDVERSSEEDEIQSVRDLFSSTRSLRAKSRWWTMQAAAEEEEEEEEPSPPPQPRLKIKIKFPAHSGSTPTTATPTPAPDDVGPSKASSRRGPSRGSLIIV